MRRYRLLIVAGVGLVAVLAGFLVFGNLNRNLVYYFTPTEATAKHAAFPDGRRFQLGGYVRPGSVVHDPNDVRFVVASGTTPGSAAIPVVYTGPLAQLFQPGIGVVLDGAWRGGQFAADTMMVKHDANYYPPGEGPRATNTPRTSSNGGGPP
jgi:cytochrome c-type biogenesis protein CcmE